uniref:Uncharacterized protein n=1 Tax=Oryza sativa subsp. japonica TaxID=39947 RepID=Q67UY7_ORYSJ|nr:hypothetical protein [Oryza sativa Japonica Group]
MLAVCSPLSPPELDSACTSPASLVVSPSNPTLETDSGGRVDAQVRRNRSPIAPSPFSLLSPPVAAAAIRRRRASSGESEPLALSLSSSLVIPVYTLSPLVVARRPGETAAAHRPFAAGAFVFPQPARVAATSVPPRHDRVG